MAKKDIIIKNHNGTDWDTLYPETSTKQVISETGENVDLLLTKKVDKVTGKQLSTNDFTNAHKTKLETTIDTELGKKVDKVAGKQLSTEDFTTSLKSKLEGIQDSVTVSGTEPVNKKGLWFELKQ